MQSLFSVRVIQMGDANWFPRHPINYKYYCLVASSQFQMVLSYNTRYKTNIVISLRATKTQWIDVCTRTQCTQVKS